MERYRLNAPGPCGPEAAAEAARNGLLSRGNVEIFPQIRPLRAFNGAKDGEVGGTAAARGLSHLLRAVLSVWPRQDARCNRFRLAFSMAFRWLLMVWLAEEGSTDPDPERWASGLEVSRAPPLRDSP